MPHVVVDGLGLADVLQVGGNVPAHVHQCDLFGFLEFVFDVFAPQLVEEMLQVERHQTGSRENASEGVIRAEKRKEEQTTRSISLQIQRN